MAEKDRDGPLADGTALAQMERLDGRVSEVLAPVIKELAEFLGPLVGKSLGTLEENKAFARLLQALLRRLGLRVRCPRCGEPAVLRCQPVRGMETGAFQFQHQGGFGPRTNHMGSSTIPELKLVAAPPDLRRLRGELRGEEG